MEKLMCLIGLHNWTAWSEPVAETWERFDRGGVLVNTFQKQVQTRRCQDCRIAQKHEVETGREH